MGGVLSVCWRKVWLINGQAGGEGGRCLRRGSRLMLYRIRARQVARIASAGVNGGMYGGRSKGKIDEGIMCIML